MWNNVVWITVQSRVKRAKSFQSRFAYSHALLCSLLVILQTHFSRQSQSHGKWHRQGSRSQTSLLSAAVHQWP